MKLGVCIPYEDKYRLSTKVPVKHLPGDNLYFIAEADCASGIPVTIGKPFAHLDKLEAARLQFTNGQPYVIID